MVFPKLLDPDPDRLTTHTAIACDISDRARLLHHFARCRLPILRTVTTRLLLRHTWQRGTNENTNGPLRQYFPKFFDLSGYHPDYLGFVAAELNNRPRKRLGWRSPGLLHDQVTVVNLVNSRQVG